MGPEAVGKNSLLCSWTEEIFYRKQLVELSIPDLAVRCPNLRGETLVSVSKQLKQEGTGRRHE